MGRTTLLKGKDGWMMRKFTTICLLVVLSVAARAFADDLNLEESKNSLARARADKAAAKATVEQAQNRLSTITTGLRSALESSPEYTAAQDSLSTAQSDSETERKKVIDQLHASTEYQNAVAAHDNANQTVQNDRDADAASGVIMIDATAAMKAGQAVTEMDADALRNDADYQADKKKVDEARTSLSKMDQQFKASLISNPSWQLAKADVDKARAQLDTADGALTAAISLEQSYAEEKQDRLANEALQRQNAQNAANRTR